MHLTVYNYYTFQSCTDLQTVPTEMFRDSYELNNYNGQCSGIATNLTIIMDKTYGNVQDSYRLNNTEMFRDSYELNNTEMFRNSYELNNYNGQNLQKCSGIATNLTSCLLWKERIFPVTCDLYLFFIILHVNIIFIIVHQ